MYNVAKRVKPFLGLKTLKTKKGTKHEVSVRTVTNLSKGREMRHRHPSTIF